MAAVVQPFSQQEIREMEERATERAMREIREWARTGLLDEIVARTAKGKGKGKDQGSKGDGKGQRTWQRPGSARGESCGSWSRLGPGLECRLAR
jgi:hypothetical protein